jgi:hypothetical protein
LDRHQKLLRVVAAARLGERCQSFTVTLGPDKQVRKHAQAKYGDGRGVNPAGRCLLRRTWPGPGRVSDLWGVAAGIADSVLVLLVLAGGALVMSHETLQTW